MRTWDDNKYTYCIGVDPGTKTGLGVWNKQKKVFDWLGSCMIHEAMAKIEAYVNAGHTVKVFVEDARLRKWFGKGAAAKMQGAGSVKRDASIWEAWLKDKGIPYEMKHPGRGMTKMRREIFAQLTKYSGHTNEHSRDAGMMVFGM